MQPDPEMLPRLLAAKRQRQPAAHDMPSAAPAPPGPRRDRNWRWSDWLYLPGMALLLAFSVGLLACLVPHLPASSAVVTLQGNLPADVRPWSTVRTIVEVRGQASRSYRLHLTFTKQAAPQTWNLAGFVAPEEGRLIVDNVTGIVFDHRGAFLCVVGQPAAMILEAGTERLTLQFDFTGLTQVPVAPGAPAPMLLLAAG